MELGIFVHGVGLNYQNKADNADIYTEYLISISEWGRLAQPGLERLLDMQKVTGSNPVAPSS